MKTVENQITDLHFFFFLHFLHCCKAERMKDWHSANLTVWGDKEHDQSTIQIRILYDYSIYDPLTLLRTSSAMTVEYTAIAVHGQNKVTHVNKASCIVNLNCQHRDSPCELQWKLASWRVGFEFLIGGSHV